MADDCANCAALQNQVSRLIGGIASTRGLILTELDEPTMNRHQLVLVVEQRLNDTLTSAY